MTTHESESELWWLTGYDSDFISWLCQLSTFNKELSNDRLTGWTQGTGCMIELTASVWGSCSLISGHFVSSLDTRSTGGGGGPGDCHCYQNSVRNRIPATLAGSQYLITHSAPSWQYWVNVARLEMMGNSKYGAPVPCSLCDDNISQVSRDGGSRGEGGVKCNKILLKNNIYSDQGPVPDVGIILPRGGHRDK